MNESTVRRLLEVALSELARDHSPLFRIDANERSLTHWLAVILSCHFPGWNVDCEYNRDGDRSKRIIRSIDAATDSLDSPTVLPDVIVHKRETDSNLLVIEAKKSRCLTRPGLSDSEKIDHYLAPRFEGGYEYKYGALVQFDVDSTSPSATITEWRRSRA